MKDYQDYIKDEDKTNECLQCGLYCEKDFCCKECAIYYIQE